MTTSRQARQAEIREAAESTQRAYVALSEAMVVPGDSPVQEERARKEAQRLAVLLDPETVLGMLGELERLQKIEISYCAFVEVQGAQVDVHDPEAVEAHTSELDATWNAFLGALTEEG